MTSPSALLHWTHFEAERWECPVHEVRWVQATRPAVCPEPDCDVPPVAAF